MQVQAFLYSSLATEFSSKTLGLTGLALYELVGVPQLLFVLKEQYSLVGGEQGEGGEDRSKVRPYLLLIIKEFIAKVNCSMLLVIRFSLSQFIYSMFFLVQRDPQGRHGEHTGLSLHCSSCKKEKLKLLNSIEVSIGGAFSFP